VSEHPVLFLTREAIFGWKQYEPGGCRCVCALYHRGKSACLSAAEPGRLLRTVTPTNAISAADISEPLPLCVACYDAIAPMATTDPQA
jgi:hypothetical protein